MVVAIDQESIMAEPVSAQIIPFPRPAPLAEAVAGEPQPLSVALTSLAQAMANQQEAVAVWRRAVRELAAQMNTMGETLATTKLKVAARD